MEIYCDCCMSLPEQVQKNKCDIAKLSDNQWLVENVTLLKQNWKQDVDKFKYDIKNEKFKDLMVFMVAPSDENAGDQMKNIIFAKSYDGGILLTASAPFDVDFIIKIYYNYNIYTK